MGERRSRQSGNSMVEMALVLTALIYLVVGAADFSRLFYTATELASSARAGAQYGSRSVVTAADTNGMIAAARQDAPNIGTITVTPSQCTCGTSSTVSACGSTYCTNAPQANYVEVDTQFTFTTVTRYPFIPSSIPLTRKAIMQVAQ